MLFETKAKGAAMACAPVLKHPTAEAVAVREALQTLRCRPLSRMMRLFGWNEQYNYESDAVQAREWRQRHAKPRAALLYACDDSGGREQTHGNESENDLSHLVLLVTNQETHQKECASETTDDRACLHGDA
jgi:hypothetical protein